MASARPLVCWGVADKSDRGASHTRIVWETSLQTILTGMWGVCATTTLWVRHEMHTVRLLTVTHFISWRTTITTTTEGILEDNRIQNRFLNYVLVLLITVLVHTWHSPWPDVYQKSHLSSVDKFLIKKLEIQGSRKKDWNSFNESI